MSQRLTGHKPTEPALQAAESTQPSVPTPESTPVMKQPPTHYSTFNVKRIGVRNQSRLEDITVEDLSGFESAIKSKLGITSDKNIRLLLNGEIVEALPDPAKLANTAFMDVVIVPDGYLKKS